MTHVRPLSGVAPSHERQAAIADRLAVDRAKAVARANAFSSSPSMLNVSTFGRGGGHGCPRQCAPCATGLSGCLQLWSSPPWRRSPRAHWRQPSTLGSPQTRSSAASGCLPSGAKTFDHRLRCDWQRHQRLHDRNPPRDRGLQSGRWRARGCAVHHGQSQHLFDRRRPSPEQREPVHRQGRDIAVQCRSSKISSRADQLGSQ